MTRFGGNFIRDISVFLKTILIVFTVIAFASISFFCSSDKSNLPVNTYLNLHDTVAYVGMETCKQCHPDIHSTFAETGMGKSFGDASKSKSAANFNQVHRVYDKALDFWYTPSWVNNELYITEYRLNGNDTTHLMRQKIDYIIGSGQHTNSHLFESNGYVFQAPLTYYTQDGKWDLPPGFENGRSDRFDRIIGLECMSCHNAYPQMVKGSENKYLNIPKGIDCERCHGPGEIHVAQKQQGILVDTSKAIDYSIVNPGKLSVDLQFDLCQRCHLQGNTVLKKGKSFFDYKPGLKLSDVMHIYLPRYKGDENSFIMASHADRLKQSECFKVMSDRAGDENALRPYKNALTCVTCHNPHVSVKNTDENHFVQKCKSCHSTSKNNECTEKKEVQLLSKNNCISCHMPVSGSKDIPHVRIHDHYIRKRPNASAKESSKIFEGLSCINESKPDSLSIAKAYLQQFEKFESNNLYLLDSASSYLKYKVMDQMKSKFHEIVQLHYLKGEFSSIINLVEKIGFSHIARELLGTQSWDNKDAWTSYRIGEAFTRNQKFDKALLCYQAAYYLAPHYFEFANKYGASAMQNNQKEQAKFVYQKLVKESPLYAPAWSNLGYIFLLDGDVKRAENFYRKSLALDPDYQPALLNLVGLHLYRNEISDAKNLLQTIVKKHPSNSQAQEILKTLK